MRMASWPCLGLVIALGAGQVVGCKKSKQTSQESTTDKGSNPPLRVAWSYWPGYSPLLIAVDRGLFNKHSLEVAPVEYDVSAKQMPDFEAGMLDAGLFAYADALTLAARSRDAYRLILVCDNSNGADVVVARPEIKTIQDLVGKRIGTGIGSFGELLVRNMLKQGGLEVRNVQLVNMSAERVPESLGRVIDAGQTWDPFAADAVTKGNHRLFSSAETPGLIADVLLIRKDAYERRQKSLRGFVDAWFEAVDFMRREPDSARAIIARMTGRPVTSINLDGVRIFDRAENREAFHNTNSPLSLVTSARVNVEFMLSTGALVAEPDLENLLQGSLLDSPSAQAGASR